MKFWLKSKFVFIMLLFSLMLTSCTRQKQDKINLNEEETWYFYSYKPEGFKLYITHESNYVYGVLCCVASEIQCSLKINHPCTPEQFKILRTRLEKYGAEFLGIVPYPETDGYPDLSQYISFVLSSDELHEFWKQLGLEN